MLAHIAGKYIYISTLKVLNVGFWLDLSAFGAVST